jgi:peptide/nickel transport system substrate-binding protein
MVLAACDGTEDPERRDPDTGTREAAPSSEEAPTIGSSLGLGDCDEQPTTCNAGDRLDGGSITWLVNQGHDGTYNHHRPEGGTEYLFQMLAGIMPRVGYFDPEGTWIWDLDLLASEPEMIDDDPQTMVYELRDDAVWSDGTPIDVDDFLWAWYHNSGREDHCVGCEPRTTAGWEDVSSIEGSDDGRTVTITLEEGATNPEWFAWFDLSYPAHVSGADWTTPEGMGESSDYVATTIPDWSGGPYLVEQWVPDERMVMVPNPDWYGDTTPTLDRVVKQVIVDQASWLPALRNREIDGGSPSSFFPDLVAEIDDLPDVHVATGSAGATWEHVTANLASLDDVAVRQAIFTALDTVDMRARIHGDLEPPLRTNHLFSELSPHHEDVLEGTGFGSGDVEAARTILAEAGYDGYDGATLVAPDGEEVGDVRFAFLAGNENRADYVELAQSFLADIGITVVPEPIPGEQLGGALAGGDFDLAIFGWGGAPTFTTTAQQLFSSPSPMNFGGLDAPELDRLAEDATQELQVEDAAAHANDVSRLVLEHAYVLPLWDAVDLVFVADGYVNVRDNHNSPQRALYNVVEWGVAAE